MLKNRPGFTVAELIIVGGFFVTIAAVVALLFVAVHFIGKVW